MSYEVQAIKKQRTNKDGSISFLVKWVGYKTPTWEPKQNLTSAKDILAEFLKEQEPESESGEEDRDSSNSFDIEETYVVEKIISHRRVGTKILYKIKWLGFEEFDEKEEEQLESCKEMLEEYKKKHKFSLPLYSPKTSPRKTRKESTPPRTAGRKERSESSSTYESRSTSRRRQVSGPVVYSPRPTRSNQASPNKTKTASNVEVVELNDTPQKSTPARRLISLDEGTSSAAATPNGNRKRKNQAAAPSPKKNKKTASESKETSEDDDDIEVISDFYTVEAIIGHITANGLTKYHVLWEAGDKTWEPEENLEPAAKMIADYKKKNMEPPKETATPRSVAKPVATPKTKGTFKQKLCIQPGAIETVSEETEAQPASSKKNKATPKQKAEPSGNAIKEIISINKIGRNLFADVIFKNGDLEKMDMDILQEVDNTAAYKSMKKKLLSLM